MITFKTILRLYPVALFFSFLNISRVAIAFFNPSILSESYIQWRYVCSLFQLAMGKMMDQGPVLIITFQAQLVMVIKNTKGEVVEGDPVSFTYPHTMKKTVYDLLELVS